MLASAATVDNAAAFSLQNGIKIRFKQIFIIALITVPISTNFSRLIGIKTQSDITQLNKENIRAKHKICKDGVAAKKERPEIIKTTSLLNINKPVIAGKVKLSNLLCK